VSVQRLVALNAVALAAAPASPAAGDVYFDTVLNGLRVYDGASWTAVGGTTVSTSPLFLVLNYA
jgi:hypothetical protein